MTCDCGNQVPRRNAGMAALASDICDRCLALDGLGDTTRDAMHVLYDGPATLEEIRLALGVKYQSQILKLMQVLKGRGRVRQVDDPDASARGGDQIIWVLCDPGRQARRTA